MGNDSDADDTIRDEVLDEITAPEDVAFGPAVPVSNRLRGAAKLRRSIETEHAVRSDLLRLTITTDSSILPLPPLDPEHTGSWHGLYLDRSRHYGRDKRQLERTPLCTVRTRHNNTNRAQDCRLQPFQCAKAGRRFELERSGFYVP